MDRIEAFELLKFLEDQGYLAGSLTAEQLIEVIENEREFEPEQEKQRLETLRKQGK